MADSNESTEETNGPQPPIIMKFDAPEESSESSTNDEADGQSAEETSLSCLKSTVGFNPPSSVQSMFGNCFSINEFDKSSTIIFGKSTLPIILRPSQLNTVTTKNSSGPSLKTDIEKSKFENPTQSKFGNSFGISEFDKSSTLRFGRSSVPTILRPSKLNTVTTKNSSGPSFETEIETSKFENPAQSKFGNSFGNSEFDKSSTITFGKSSVPTIARSSQPNTVTTKNSSGPSLETDIEMSKCENPFRKVTDTETIDDNASELKKPEESKDEKTSSKINNKETKTTEESTTSTPKFLPLGSSPKENDTNVNNTMGPNCSTASFVFGQNLKDRVAVANNDDGTEEAEDDKPTNETPPLTENGSSELLFSSAATVCRSTSRPGLTLSQAAQEIEEANRANKRKYNQVTLLTGEEDETNILQVNCKLFAFDKVTSGWKERGRGTLRLNDRDEESRLVGRATGTQRLILNTKVWPGMTAERAGPKSLRLTAMDVHGDIRIFIVQAAPAEVDQLHNHLIQRLKRAKERQPKKLATGH